MNNIVNILVALVVFWVVYTYLIPLLPAPIQGVALVLAVLAAIVYLFRLVA